MSVVGIAAELPDSPSGQINEESSSFTRRFLVLTNSYADGPLVVINAVGIPRPLQAYGTANESHAFARVRSYDAKRTDPNSLYWEVEVSYETKEEEDEDENENPLLEPPEAEMTSERFDEPVQGTVNNTTDTPARLKKWDGGLTNSAGEAFDPQPVRDAHRTKLSISRNEDINTNIMALQKQFLDAVNSDTFWGRGAGEAKLQDIKATKKQKKITIGETELEFYYLRTTYEIEFRDTWDLELLDIGNYYLVSASTTASATTKKNFKTDDGHPYLGLLDGGGGKLGDGADPVFLPPKQIYVRKAFAALNLPQSFAEVKAKSR